MRERIETDRLVLRRYAEGDLERLLQILGDERVYPWLDDPPYDPPTSVERVRESLTRWAEREIEDPFAGYRAIEADGRVVGSVLISRLTRKDGGYVGEREIGWHLAPDAWGHGYAVEAARALLTAAFDDGLEEIWCDMYPNNEPSRRVAEQLGLELVGVVPDPWYQGDGLIFRANRQEWA